ncbi:ABC transporter permease [Corynebacterium tuberculostearicum]|uniref:ABC transporter permease n=1 Tax=Corynebacterium tuberculostearicum TaxID=38304 RepID=UPI0029352A36|nr:ABC transporter permease [Corynebacterium tuberculostearicum]MDV2431448.1 ABC transporter permease [Corynebacterium tuberculostearicum]
MSKRDWLLVDDRRLKNLRARLPLPQYTSELWRRRFFILAEARGRSLRGGNDTFLGKAWIVLDPLFQVTLYAIVFGLILGVSKGMENFVGFLTIGVIFYRQTTRGFSTGIGLVQSAKNLIASFNFPRAAVVFSVALKNTIDGIAPSLVAVFVALLLQFETVPSMAVLLVVPIYVLIQFFNIGVSFVVARVTAFIPDMKTPISLFTRALFFLSGIFFTLERYEGHPALIETMKLNPIYQFLTAIRTCVLDGNVPEVSVWLYLSAWSIGLAVFGYIYFWMADERYANVK